MEIALNFFMECWIASLDIASAYTMCNGYYLEGD